ncbi:MAG: hypothetical protein IKY83_14030 [Proteobacteria bacterium]|nr:hypothetical protein [Pseudomonadota bacterium]
MKAIRFSLILAAALISSTAQAVPSYDAPEWSNYIEKKAGNKIPEGYPTGAGAISGFNGSGFWRTPYTSLIRPIDMSGSDILTVSKTALSLKKHYASESMQSFLQATSGALRKLSKRADLKIPVQGLAYEMNNVPQSDARAFMTVQLGVYTKSGTDSVPDADFSIHAKPPTDNDITHKRTQAYIAKVMPNLAALRQMPPQQAQNELQRLGHESNEAVSAEIRERITGNHLPTHRFSGRHLSGSIEPPQEGSYAQRYKALNDAYNAQIQTLRDESQQAEGDKRAELTRQILQLEAERDQQLLELPDDEQLPSAETIRSKQERQKAYKEELHRRALELGMTDEDDRETQQALREQISNQQQMRQAERNALKERIKEQQHTSRMTQAQRQAYRNAQKEEIEQAQLARVDLETTWLMFEAMITQNSETILKITMPESLKIALIDHAKTAKRPDKAIKTFDSLSEGHARNAISILLACSVRDRFLGCPIKGNDKTEAKVNDIAQKILNQAKSAPIPDQMRAIQLVVNAAPQKVKNTLNLDSMTRPADTTLELPFDDAPPAPANADAIRADLISRYRQMYVPARSAKKAPKTGKKQRSNEDGRAQDVLPSLPF